MNKLMKTTMMLLVASTMILFASCNKDNEQSWIVGKWLQTAIDEGDGKYDVSDMGMYYVFNSDGTMTILSGQWSSEEDSYTYRYRISGDNLYMYFIDEDGDEVGHDLKIKSHDDKTMVLENEDAEKLGYYEKVN